MMEMRKEASGHYKLRDQVQPLNKAFWPTPSKERSGTGELLDELQTKEGEPPKQGERLYAPGRKHHSQVTLDRAVKLWPTPLTIEVEHPDAPKTEKGRRITKEGKDGRSMGLADAVRMLPTPISRDSRTKKGAKTMPNHQGSEPLVVQVGGSLNPTWVEWLMGFPIGWTDLPPSGTP